MEKRAIPDGLTVFQDRSAIVIRRRWSMGKGASALFLTSISAWPLLLGFHWGTHGDGPWPLLMEYLPHVGAVFGAAYFGLCSLFNRTDVMISVDWFRAVSTPLPWWGDRKVSARDIHAVVVRERKAGEDGANFVLLYVDRNGKERELLRAGKGRKQIDFIGRAVADIMGVDLETPGAGKALAPWMERVNQWVTSGSGSKRKTEPVNPASPVKH
jgi:hypothetical protein